MTKEEYEQRKAIASNMDFTGYVRIDLDELVDMELPIDVTVEDILKIYYEEPKKP